jgi:serine/threonine protein kinase
MHLATPPPSPRSVRPDIPRDLDEFLLTLLAKDPGNRPANAAAIAAELRGIESRYRQSVDTRLESAQSHAERIEVFSATVNPAFAA